MRTGRLLKVLVAAAILAIGASWLRGVQDYVVHERAAAEWAALTLAEEALAEGRQPQDADAAAFLSNAVIDKAMKLLVGTTIRSPTATFGDLTITVEGARLQPGLGLTGVIVDARVASTQRVAEVRLTVEGSLAFRGIVPRRHADGQSIATAEFAIGVLRVEPHLPWGFLDIPARHFLSDAISSGLMLALDDHLAVVVPFEDRLSFNTGFSGETIVRAPDGTVTLNTSLAGSSLEQRFSFSTPLFLRSGVWLMATGSRSGQEPVARPTVAGLSPAELERGIARLRDTIASRTQTLEQKHDFVLLLRGSALVALIDQLGTLPEANRTVVVRSTGVTGHLVNNDTVLLELPDAHAVGASLVIGPPRATWAPGKGAALSTDLRMDLHAQVHAHVKPVVNMGTVLGLEGTTGKRVAGVLEMTNQVIDGHSVLLLGTAMPCDTLSADVTTDGRLVVGPVKVDLVKVGVRWTMPVPPALGRPQMAFDDLPRCVALNPEMDDWGITVTPGHGAIEYAVSVTSAEATQVGYAVTADLDLRPVDTAESPPEIGERRRALARSAQAAVSAAAACPSVDPDMKVLFGGAEFGKGNEFVKALVNTLHDLQHGPGDSNDLVGKDGFVGKKLEDMKRDLGHGPGPSNDLVGKNGAVRRFFRRIRL